MDCKELVELVGQVQKQIAAALDGKNRFLEAAIDRTLRRYFKDLPSGSPVLCN